MYRRLLGSWILSRPDSACHHLPPGSRIAPRRVHSPPYAPLTRSLQLPIIRGGVAFRGVAIACCFFALGLVGFEWRLGGRRAGQLGHWRRGVGRYESMEYVGREGLGSRSLLLTSTVPVRCHCFIRRMHI